MHYFLKVGIKCIIPQLTKRGEDIIRIRYGNIMLLSITLKFIQTFTNFFKFLRPVIIMYSIIFYAL